MNYEVEKQLKDAGFTSKSHVLARIPGVKGVEQLPDPTLSELIEACGGGYKSLNRMVGNPFKYFSSKPDKTVWWSAPLENIVNEGATPEEAVARLWLQLQSNKKAA
jgi:hypothetical protein